ncbi:MAG: hypothetical protein KC620_14955 [Myxococcales bacterium]|nr:hypothetical protein [Myxococcales bacterium]
MFRLAFRRARLRFALGAAFALALPLWLPAAPSARAWTLSALCLLAPWLVLGRDARSQAEGWRQALCDVPRGGRLVLLELLPPFGVLLLGALMGTGFAWRPAVALVAWGACLVTAADAFDRGFGRAGPAWVAVLIAALALMLAPLWLAPWFGEARLAPWLATGAIALHPAGVVLSAADLPALQDPMFYAFSLSGVVEVRPVPWTWGTAVFSLAAAAGAARAVRAVRRLPATVSPARSWV